MNWDYVAGFFDSEGSIGTYGNSGMTLQVEVGCQKGNVQTLEEIRRFLLLEGISAHLSVENRKGVDVKHQMTHLVLLSRRANVLLFLRSVFPYIRMKKYKAQDSIRFLTLFPDLRGPMNRISFSKRITKNVATGRFQAHGYGADGSQGEAGGHSA